MKAAAAGIVLGWVLVAATAGATPRALPFTYTTDQLAQGETELEQYGDLTPVKAVSTSTGLPVAYAATQFQTELEYGIRDDLELGLYVTLAPSAGDGYTSSARLPEGNGLKQRLRFALAPQEQWPIDVSLYAEIVENDHEIELEEKILLQRRFGKLRLDANLWGEYELYYEPQRDIVINPTLGATYEITPSFHVGAESWMRMEFPVPALAGPRPFSLGPAVYVGPAVLLAFGKVWWSTGVYGRASDPGHEMQPGEPYGPVWLRTVVGLEL